MKLVANNPQSLAHLISKIKEEYNKGKYLKVTIARGRDRSLEQNNLFHEWVMQLVVAGGEYDFDGYRNFCRLHFFVPVLIHENEDFSDLWWSLFDREKSKRKDADQYRTQLHLIGTITGISSICTTAQFSRALELMQQHFAGLENDPVFLEFSES